MTSGQTDTPEGAKSKTNQSAKPVAWARVWPTVKPAWSRILRQGAWYPVIEDDEPSKVVLDIGGKASAVPRRLLEIRPGDLMPDFFAVVYRAPKEGPEGKQVEAETFVVCPKCKRRQQVWSRPERLTCPACDHRAEIAWWETG
ncbi:MAG: hypothetical protein O7I93_14440 [Gemmatimonadetes bacterium]|nr:hypothetical protein [Gemmatimonadota bacterium]